MLMCKRRVCLHARTTLSPADVQTATAQDDVESASSMADEKAAAVARLDATVTSYSLVRVWSGFVMIA